MDYKSANDIRKKSFGSLLAEQEGGLGTSLRKALSLKTQSKITGIKEKFDPLNIAKKLTGGSNWAPAMLGKLTGRNHKALEYFAGAKPKKGLGALLSGGGDIDSSPTEILGSIYEELKKADDNKRLELEEQRNKKEEEDREEDSRNAQLIKALTGRVVKPPTRKEKKAQRRVEKKAKKKVVEERVPTKGVPTKETPKVRTTKAPKPEAVTSKVPKPEAVTSKAPISTAARVATGAAIVAVGVAGGKATLAANIAQYESGKAGYNAYNKGTVGNRMIPSDVPIDFSKMTITEFLRRGELKPGNPERLFAVGKYQIIPPTMKDLVKQLKLDPNVTVLDPVTQESLFENGLVGSRRKKVDDYIKGRSDDRDGAILQLAQEFASVGVPYPAGKATERGQSYYSGIGGNKAHNSPEQVGKALDVDRQNYLKNKKPETVPNVTTPVTNNTGAQIDSSSRQNKELKESLEVDKPTIIQNTNNTSTTQTAPQTSPTKPKVDDRPAPIKKAQG